LPAHIASAGIEKVFIRASCRNKTIIVSARGLILNRFVIHPVKILKVFWISASFSLLTAFVNSTLYAISFG
jgi:hypothetical protein